MENGKTPGTLRTRSASDCDGNQDCISGPVAQSNTQTKQSWYEQDDSYPYRASEACGWRIIIDAIYSATCGSSVYRTPQRCGEISLFIKAAVQFRRLIFIFMCIGRRGASIVYRKPPRHLESTYAHFCFSLPWGCLLQWHGHNRLIICEYHCNRFI